MIIALKAKGMGKRVDTALLLLRAAFSMVVLGEVEIRFVDAKPPLTDSD